MFPVSHLTWRILRTVLRKGGIGIVGAQLRLKMNRATKSGEFLDCLVSAGLLSVVAIHETTAENKGKAQQFRTVYTLTEKGRETADTGMIDQTSVDRERAAKYLPYAL